MADIWTERLAAKRKGELPATETDRMRAFPLQRRLPITLSQGEVGYVRVCSFTFVFHSLEQLQACLDYYSKKTHPSSRIPSEKLFDYGGDCGERQRWFERLPMYLLEEPKRRKVVAALKAALARWSVDSDRNHGNRA